MPPDMKAMSREEFLTRTGVPAERLDEMIALGLVVEADGGFTNGDLRRVRLFHNLDDGGLPLDAVADAVRDGDLSFAFFDLPYWERFGALTDKTLGDIVEDGGISLELLQVIRESMGYARPDSQDAVREDELPQIELLRAGLAAGADPVALERQIRVWGESLRKLSQADANFYHSQFEVPLLKSGMTPSQVMEMASHAGEMMAPLLDGAVLGLYHALSEHTWMANVIEAVESTLEHTGRHRAAANPPSICFLDLTGYTRLTEERGDEAAAALAASFSQEVYRSSQRYRGRPVKWLGDGVMIVFDDAASAVEGSLDMVEHIPAAGLPPAHVGIDSGTVVYQDGDYFGRTVNIAARIAGRATAGEVLVSDRVRDAVSEATIGFAEAGPAELKGLEAPIQLFRALRV